MIIFIINNFSVSVLKTESNTPICLHGYSLGLFSFTLQFVEGKSRDLHVFDCPGLIKLGQDESQPLGMLCLDSRQTSGKEKFLQSFMRKTPYHLFIVTPVFSHCNHIGYIYFATFSNFVFNRASLLAKS